jgi:hypothetical protein
MPADFDEVIDEDKRLVRGWGSVEVVDTDKQIVPVDEIEKTLDEFVKANPDAVIPISDKDHSDKILGQVVSYKKAMHPSGKAGLLLDYEIHKGQPYFDEAWAEIKSGERIGLRWSGAYNAHGTMFVKGRPAEVVGQLQTFAFASCKAPKNPLALNTNANYKAASGDAAFDKEFEKEKKEHPSFSDEQVRQIVMDHQKIEMHPVDGTVEKRVERRDGKWAVVHCHGDEKAGDVIGLHDTREEAEAQHRAIMAHEHGKKTESIKTDLEDVAAGLAMRGKTEKEIATELDRQFGHLEYSYDKNDFEEAARNAVTIHGKKARVDEGNFIWTAGHSALELFGKNYGDLTPEQKKQCLQHAEQRVKELRAKEGSKDADARPPKEWFDDCVAAVQASGGAKDANAVCGNLWHNKMKSKLAGKTKAGDGVKTRPKADSDADADDESESEAEAEAKKKVKGDAEAEAPAEAGPETPAASPDAKLDKIIALLERLVGGVPKSDAGEGERAKLPVSPGEETTQAPKPSKPEGGSLKLSNDVVAAIQSETKAAVKAHFASKSATPRPDAAAPASSVPAAPQAPDANANLALKIARGETKFNFRDLEKRDREAKQGLVDNALVAIRAGKAN